MTGMRSLATVGGAREGRTRGPALVFGQRRRTKVGVVMTAARQHEEALAMAMKMMMVACSLDTVGGVMAKGHASALVHGLEFP